MYGNSKIYRKMLIVSGLSGLLIGVGQVGATTIAYQGFEGAGGDTWGYSTGVATTGSNTGPTHVGGVSTNNGSWTSTPFLDGIHSFQTTDATGTLTFNAFNVTGLKNVQVQIPVATIGETAGDGPDTGDTVAAYVALNGAGFSGTPDILLGATANSQGSFASGATATTIVGAAITPTDASGSRPPNTYNLLLINVPDGTTSVALQIIATDVTSSSHEVWAVDGITLASVPEPGSLGLMVAGAGMLGLMRRRSAKRS